MAAAPLEDIGLAEDVMPLGHLLLRSARRDPDKDALVFPDRRVTLPRARGHAWGVARSLLALGVQPGEHVGVLMTNHPDLVASVFGASLIGGRGGADQRALPHHRDAVPDRRRRSRRRCSPTMPRTPTSTSRR